ncbi:MAG: CHAT domain-containing protein, partial [Gammaproteobacteria bacterium]|nr:CHAT domain-containing protein [Gammaproteobacteria bacterium]
MSQPTPFIITPPADLLKDHPPIKGMAESLSSAYASHKLVEEKHLQAMGQALWDALPNGAALEAAKQAAGQQALPIIIESDHAAILTLPWETLYHPQYGFLGRETGFSLSRRNPTIKVRLPDVPCEPLRVLLFTSLPDDLTELERLDVEAEQAAVQEALMKQEQAGEIVLEMPDDGRLDTFRASLQHFQPHLVYLSGHGNFTHEHHNQQAYGSFLFEDAIGRKQEVSETELTACFQNTQVQLLVLSACLSAKQHPNYPHNGLSAALYKAGIPHVIGMRESVFDKAGIQFAKALLETLGKRTTVDVALQQARNAITQPLKEAGGYKESSNPIRTEASYGQWCLPQLLSHDLKQGLVDWGFTPQPRKRAELKTLLGQISVPEQFRGRRRELRQWQNRLRSEQNSLLITGIGGMGKTALANKLLQGLHKDGYQTFSFSLRPEHDWQNVLLDMELALAEDEGAYKKYELIQRKGLDEAAQASYFLKFLLARYGGKLALFFDNLESVQDGKFPHAVTDPTLQHWLQAAQQLTTQGLKLILTSRWRLPDWAEAAHYPLGKPVYGDYVAMVRLKGLPLNGARLQTAYETLGGNFRALEFFAEATRHMSVKEEQAFIAALDKAADDSQTDMALAKVLEQRHAGEHALLHRLLAYQTAVPLTGLEVLWEEPSPPNPLSRQAGEGGQDDWAVLQRLLAVSLVEQFTNPYSEETEYQLAPLVRSWLLANGAPDPSLSMLQTAAEFLLWQLEERQNTTWEHQLSTHAALLAANLTEQGQRLVLDWIIGPLTMAGMYRTLLDDWLPPLAEADNQQIKGEALGQIGKQYLHIGQYDTALDFLKKSLAIQQEIGDKSGEGTTLNNISQIYDARGDYDTALDFLKKSLAIRQEIGDKSGEGTTLNNISQIYDARGDYDTALDFLKKSLAIRQEI